MTQHTKFDTRLEALQQRVAATKSAVRSAATESEAQLTQRIDQARADLARSAKSARGKASQAADSTQAKVAELKADATARMGSVRTTLDKGTRQMDARVAAKDADWAEAHSAEALDFADQAVENAQLAMLDAVSARAYADKLAKAAADS